MRVAGLWGAGQRHLWPTVTADEAAELRAKGFRFSIYRPEEDEYRLSLPLQTIEDRVHETITIEQGEVRKHLRPADRAAATVRQQARLAA